MNFKEYMTSTTVSLFLVAIRNLVCVGPASTFGHLCVAAMRVAFKCRRKGIPALPSADLQPELEQWMPVAGNGQASLVLLIKFIYLIHAGDDFNNEKSAPFYPSLSEYWQFLFIIKGRTLLKTTSIENYFIFWAYVFYLQFIKEEINLSQSISPKVMKERILLLSHFSTSQVGS